MSIALILLVAGIIGGTLWLHIYVAPPGARTVLKFDAGQVKVTRGSLGTQSQTYVQDVLRGAGLIKGSIGISANGRLWFSPSVPESAHQQLRNILMP